MTDQLHTYTIYEHPLDFPDGYAMTEWAVGPTGPRVVATVYAATLEKARALIPPGLVRLERDPADDPVILETWM